MHRPTLIKCSPRNVKVVSTPLASKSLLIMANCYSNRSDWPHRRRRIDLCNGGMLSFRHYFTRPLHIHFSGQWVGTFLSKNVPYDLHCTVFIRSCCSLFAVRLSRYTSASTLVVRYCSKSSRHRYRKMKMKMNIIWYMVLWVHTSVPQSASRYDTIRYEMLF